MASSEILGLVASAFVAGLIVGVWVSHLVHRTAIRKIKASLDVTRKLADDLVRMLKAPR